MQHRRGAVDGIPVLKIPPAEHDELRRHGEEAYPDECCGILLGHVNGQTRVVRTIVRCRNACAESQRTRYEIDARDLIRTQLQGRESGLEIVGFYHSHPDHSSQWSPRDLQDAHWLGCSYVITTVEQGRATVTKSFLLAGRLEEDKWFADEELSVSD